MQFRKIQIEDLKIIDNAISNNKYFNNYMGSEFTPLFLLTWGKECEICYDEDDIFIKGYHDGLFFLPPISNDLEKAYKKIYNNFSDFYFRGVSEELNALDFPNYRDWDEYLYDSKLLSLSGKNLHKKRNLVNQFMKNEYIFKEYEEKDYDNIINLSLKWNNFEDYYELDLIKEALKYIGTYAFCDLIYMNNEIVAFSIGTIYKNIGYSFFEKADISVKGSFQAINYLFSNKHYSDVLYINRQDDLGDLGMRKAKESYYPVKMVKKYKNI